MKGVKLAIGVGLVMLSLVGYSQGLQPKTNAPANVTLAWDASTDTHVVGYHVYYGSAPGFYTNMISVGSATLVTLSNLVRGATLYFAATAVASDGLESVFSNEISYTPPLRPAAPVLRLAISADGQLVIGTGEPYAWYQVERTQDLMVWVPVGLRQADGQGGFTFNSGVPIGPSLAVAFFRTKGEDRT